MRINCLPAGLIVAWLGGCGTVTIGTNPNTFSVSDPTATLRAGQTLVLDNAYPGETKEIIRHDGRWDADMQKLTDTAIAILQRHLEKNGIGVASGAAKKVTLRVRNVVTVFKAIPFASRVNASLVLEARLGDGSTITTPAENGAPVYAGTTRVVDGAILFAVTGLLNDTRFVDYVNR